MGGIRELYRYGVDLRLLKDMNTISLEGVPERGGMIASENHRSDLGLGSCVIIYGTTSGSGSQPRQALLGVFKLFRL